MPGTRSRRSERKRLAGRSSSTDNSIILSRELSVPRLKGSKVIFDTEADFAVILTAGHFPRCRE